MQCLSKNKRHILVPKLFYLAEMFCFATLPLHFHVQSERTFVKLFDDGMWEKELISDVQCRQENPNSRVHRSSGKRGLSSFPLERWTLGFGFYCPHWTPLMDSIYPSSTFFSNTNVYKILSSLCLLTAKSIPHRWLCEISVAIFEISYTRRLTSWRSQLSDNVGFLRLWRWLVQQRFKTSNAYSSFICE